MGWKDWIIAHRYMCTHTHTHTHMCTYTRIGTLMIASQNILVHVLQRYKNTNTTCIASYYQGKALLIHGICTPSYAHYKALLVTSHDSYSAPIRTFAYTLEQQQPSAQTCRTQVSITLWRRRVEQLKNHPPTLLYKLHGMGRVGLYSRALTTLESLWTMLSFAGCSKGLHDDPTSGHTPSARKWSGEIGHQRCGQWPVCIYMFTS